MSTSMIVESDGLSTESIRIPAGDHLIYIDCDVWTGLSVTLKLYRNNKDYDALEGTDVVVFTANTAKRISGGQVYKVLVDGYDNNPINIEAVPCSVY